MIPSKHPTLIDEHQAITYGSIVALQNNAQECYMCVNLLSALTVNRTKVGLWEQFVIESIDGDNRIGEPVCFTDFINLKSHNGKYLGATSTGGLTCKTDKPTEKTSFCINSGDNLKADGIDMSTVAVMNQSNVSFWSNSEEKYITATKSGAAHCDNNTKGIREGFKIQMTLRQPLSEKFRSNTGSPKPKKKTDNLYDYIDEPTPLYGDDIMSITDNDACGAAMESLYNMVKSNNFDAAEHLSRNIDVYFSGFSNKALAGDYQLDRLFKQYKTIKKDYEERRKVKKKKQKVVQQDLDFGEDEYVTGQQQMQQIKAKPKMTLSESDKTTYEVEKKIALETYEAVKELETEYKDLHNLMKDMNTLLHEQDPTINMISSNVEYANNNVAKGRTNIKSASKYTLMG